MTDKSNNPFKFWEELKRRKVVRVVIGYLASAYVILELVSIIAEPLGLPEWTIGIVFVLLCVGFIIAFLLSWIYDFTSGGIKKTESSKAIKGKPKANSEKRKLKVSDLLIAGLLISVVVLAYPKIFKKDKFEDIREIDGRISIAVLPFKNMTGDTELDWYGSGIASLITNGLGSSSGLIVSDDQTMLEIIESIPQVVTAGISKAQAKVVANKVGAGTFISGAIHRNEDTYRILANLVDTKSGEIIWTDNVEGNLKSKYLDLVDSLCKNIINHLEIKLLKEEVDYDFREAFTNSAEAFKYYHEGMKSILTMDIKSAVHSLNRALEIDSTFTFAYFYIAYAYSYDYNLPESKRYTKIAYKTKDRLPLKYQYWLELWYACYWSKDQSDIIRYCNLLEEPGIDSRFFWFDLGVTYDGFTRQYNKAVKAFEKVEEITMERGVDWKYYNFYFEYAETLHNAEKYEKEKEILETGRRLFPDRNLLILRQGMCALSQGDTIEANEYIKSWKSHMRERGWTEPYIDRDLALAYHEANFLDKAEVHLKNALEMDPDLFVYPHFSIANFLIDTDIKVNYDSSSWQSSFIEGLELYKQNDYSKALEPLQKAFDLRPAYFYDLDQLIQEVEQALAKQLSEQ